MDAAVSFSAAPDHTESPFRLHWQRDKSIGSLLEHHDHAVV